MVHQMAGLVHDPLLQVFLDVREAYGSLYRELFLELLRRYGLGPNLSWLLKNYWKRQRIFPKSGNCLGTAFGSVRGVKQGDPVSPMIFTIVVDVVVRAVLGFVCIPQEAQHGWYWRRGRETFSSMRITEGYRVRTMSGYRMHWW